MRTRVRPGRPVSTIMAVAVLLLASCSTSPALPPAASATSATTTKPYGSLTIATNVATGVLDPLRSNHIGYSTVGAPVFDSLWHRDVRTSELTVDLPERWEISPDGLTHTFYIRKGVKFHDGSDLTAADVKFSIERLMSQTSIQTDVATWRAAVASVELKDDYTVALRMKSPQFELLQNQSGAMTAVMPKKYIEEKGGDFFARQPVGSGPWKVVKYEPGVRFELEALDSHWRAAPKFRNVTILSVPDESTKVAMLRTGELDMASVSADSAAGLEASGLRIQSYFSGGGYYAFVLYDVGNPQKHAVGDVRVRKALQLGINAKELADKLFRGRAEPVMVTVNYVASAAKINALDPNLLRPDPHDPEGAKKLMAESGYPNGFSTRIYDTGAGDMRSVLSLALAGYWGKIGVNAEVVPYEYGAFNTLYKANNPETWNSVYPLVTAGANEWQNMIVRHHSKRGTARNVSNPRLDWLLDNIPGTSNPEQRDKYIFEAIGLARNEYNILSILGTHNILALSKKIGDVAPARFVNEISGLMLETVTHAK